MQACTIRQSPRNILAFSNVVLKGNVSKISKWFAEEEQALCMYKHVFTLPRSMDSELVDAVDSCDVRGKGHWY
jgi:hypothetical protein